MRMTGLDDPTTINDNGSDVLLVIQTTEKLTESYNKPATIHSHVFNHRARAIHDILHTFH